MSQQTIGLGSAANDGTGDALRVAGGKINANFSELYTAVAGLVIGTTVQAHSAKLDAFAGLTFSADKLVYATGADTLALADLTAFGRSLIGGVDAAAVRTTLELGTLATQSGTFSGTSSGTNTGDQTITLTGDVTGSGAGSFATAIGATKVTSAMLNADVFSTAHSWGGQQTFIAPVLGTPASATLTNATGLPIGGLTGLGSGIAAFLATPSSANLLAAVTDETGSGSLVFAIAPALTGPVTSSITTTVAGTRYGFSSVASGADINVAVRGESSATKNSARNIGGLFYGLNTGTSPVMIGAVATLSGTEPTVSAALIADNGSQTSPIFLARDNGSTVFTVADGGNVALTGAITMGGSATIAGTLINAAQMTFLNGTRIRSDALGDLMLDRSVAGDVRLLLGGISNLFPSFKRSTTSLQARLADDSAFTNIQGKLTTDAPYTAGVVTDTGYLTIYDSTGAAYKVPCVAA